MSIFQAARTYQEHNTPVVVIAGRRQGLRRRFLPRWAAKGPKLLGVRAILPSPSNASTAPTSPHGHPALQFLPGQSAQSLGLTGEETITIRRLASAVADPTRRQNRTRKPRVTGPG